MKLPDDVVIPEEQLVRYLLLPRPESDKSQFLGVAGYTLATWEVLARDLHTLAKTHEVSDTTISPYGIKWEVRGTRTGLNGQVLHVVTVWIPLEASGETRFMTLFPDRETAMRHTKVALYQRVALLRDLPEHHLCKGDVAIVVEHLPGTAASGGEDGYSLEVCNAIGDTIAVVMVPVSAVKPLTKNEVFQVRSLGVTEQR